MAHTSKVYVSAFTEAVYFRRSIFTRHQQVVSVVVTLTYKMSPEERSYGSSSFLFDPITCSFQRITSKQNYEFSPGWLRSLIFGTYSKIPLETYSMNSPQSSMEISPLSTRQHVRNYVFESKLTFTDWVTAVKRRVSRMSSRLRLQKQHVVCERSLESFQR